MNNGGGTSVREGTKNRKGQLRNCTRKTTRKILEGIFKGKQRIKKGGPSKKDCKRPDRGKKNVKKIKTSLKQKTTPGQVLKKTKRGCNPRQ